MNRYRRMHTFSYITLAIAYALAAMAYAALLIGGTDPGTDDRLEEPAAAPPAAPPVEVQAPGEAPTHPKR